MSQRISLCFERAGERGRKLLVPFITAGDPDPGWTVALMHALVAGGADMIELGVPFSDPMADGPVIQLASERAIAKNVDLTAVLEMVSEFRQADTDTPVILMGYMNPIERYGQAKFPGDAKNAGVDGLLLVDCPPEERGDLGLALDEAGLDGICLIAPTTYYVSLKGITGAGDQGLPELAGPVGQIREFSDLPIAVGFGIKNAATAANVALHADACVIGSALVETLAVTSSREEACAAAKAFVAPVRESLDNMLK
jgi:tryptophan synthase alpha chain